uniref:DUF4503 domain-containing protein n=1 Tax=Sinocyclocheilus rhinocerous TaxID=307959 RepID=A0A673LL14_9TELE
MCVGVLVSRKGFLCLACGAVMDEPTTKMELEVFLSCSSLSHCTVKIKVRSDSFMTYKCYRILIFVTEKSRSRFLFILFFFK